MDTHRKGAAKQARALLDLPSQAIAEANAA
jgi:hypothetical protein